MQKKKKDWNSREEVTQASHFLPSRPYLKHCAIPHSSWAAIPFSFFSFNRCLCRHIQPYTHNTLSDGLFFCLSLNFIEFCFHRKCINLVLEVWRKKKCLCSVVLLTTGLGKGPTDRLCRVGSYLLGVTLQRVWPLESEQPGAGERGEQWRAPASRPRVHADHQAPGPTADHRCHHWEHHPEVWHTLSAVCHTGRYLLRLLPRTSHTCSSIISYYLP